MVGMRVMQNGLTVSTRYFQQDHLGSVSVITNESGTVLERLSYDAWGKRRFPNGADDPTGSITSQTAWGFTGQEMLAGMGIVHLNGRVYDPLVARMMSADPYVPDALDGQAWNPYSYVVNNPLAFTDPSGYCFLGLCGVGQAVNNFFRSAGKFLASPAGSIASAIVASVACSVTTAAYAICVAAVTGIISGAVAGIQTGRLDVALRAGLIAGVTAGVTAGVMQGLGVGADVAGESETALGYASEGYPPDMAAAFYDGKLHITVPGSGGLDAGIGGAGAAINGGIGGAGAAIGGGVGSAVGVGLGATDTAYYRLWFLPCLWVSNIGVGCGAERMIGGGGGGGGGAAKGLGKYEVGPYNVLRQGAEPGLDAHHVGQKGLMKDFVKGYDLRTAPSILVPKAGHTLGEGVLSRKMQDIENPRDLIARDIWELRRVYPDIPNSQLQKLIDLNKQLYPEVR
jgi:RHS repeat-associated protein